MTLEDIPTATTLSKMWNILAFIYTMSMAPESLIRSFDKPVGLRKYAQDGDQKVVSEIEIYAEGIRARPDSGVKRQTRVPAHK
jgi:hypothetical protein